MNPAAGKLNVMKLLAVCRRRREAVGPIANPSPKTARCAKFAMFYTPYVGLGLSGLARLSYSCCWSD